jgi:hypothetical protein
MAGMLTRVRIIMRSLGNEGAVANVRSDMATAAQDRDAVDRLVQRLAVLEAGRAPRAA